MQVHFPQLITKQVSIQVSIMTVRLHTLPATTVKCHNIVNHHQGTKSCSCVPTIGIFLLPLSRASIYSIGSLTCDNEEQITVFVVANT